MNPFPEDSRFLGSTKDCFYHLCKVREGDRAAFVKELQNEIGVSESAISYWLRDDAFPRGSYLLKLMHFLRRRQYGPSEFATIHPIIFLWGKGIDEGKITLEESAKAVGYVKITYAHGPLLGQRGMNREYIARLSRYLSEHGVHADNAEEQLPDQSTTEVLPEATPKAELAPKVLKEKKTEVKTAPRGVEISKEAVLQSLAAGIGMIRPLAKLLLSEQFDAKDREKLRELVEDDGIFHLKNDLTRLSSETAFARLA